MKRNTDDNTWKEKGKRKWIKSNRKQKRISEKGKQNLQAVMFPKITKNPRKRRGIKNVTEWGERKCKMQNATRKRRGVKM